MEKRINEANFEETGYSYTLSLISGKYKPIILYCLMEYEPVRFNEMQRYLGRVADKTLSMHLKELERDGLVRIHTDLGVVCSVIAGSFPTADAEFDPERNAVYVAVAPSVAVRDALTEMPIPSDLSTPTASARGT
jgi:predicted transcriptional regulator